MEELVAKWYEYKGYFVKRNVRPHPKELDVVAFNPNVKGMPQLVHVEATGQTFDKREKEKFNEETDKLCRKLFKGFGTIPQSVHKQAVVMKKRKTKTAIFLSSICRISSATFSRIRT